MSWLGEAVGHFRIAGELVGQLLLAGAERAALPARQQRW